MALTDATLALLGAELDSLITHASLHTADPGSTGANESVAARQAVTITVDGDGDLTLDSALNFTGGAASGACTHVGLWSASTSGTFRGGYALSGDQTFNSAGEYTVTALTILGTAS